ncbi:hypothetical protein GF325_09640 [Candidatus Bathyarchaeota archaeon]|nr:hypothetical protein [Candidatus Bathyarchaeota archaeon]
MVARFPIYDTNKSAGNCSPRNNPKIGHMKASERASTLSKGCLIFLGNNHAIKLPSRKCVIACIKPFSHYRKKIAP